MGISLYDATVGSFLQHLGALAGLIDKAEAFARAGGLTDAEVLEARLAPDMFPFAMQVKQARYHAVDSLTGVRAGVFSPSRAPAPADFAGLRALVAEAVATLQAETEASIAELAGKPCEFVARGARLPFAGAAFLLSFSLPNFYFHVTTAYAILRHLGADIGKRDYMGAIRASGPAVREQPPTDS